MTNYPLLLISGVTATGKTTFGQWLQDTKSYLHIDVEQTQFIPAISDLKTLARPVFLTWGFRPEAKELDIVTELKSQGVSTWWFHAEMTVARECFLRRGTIDVAAFDDQMSRINQEWEKLEKLFSPNILETLNNDGYPVPETIYGKITATN